MNRPPPVRHAAPAPGGRVGPTSRRVISRALRTAIEDSGLVPFALAREAGIDPGIVKRFLNDQRDIRLDTLDRLADVLNLRLVEAPRDWGRTRTPRRGERRPPVRQPETHRKGADTVEPCDRTSPEDPT